jgi:hypothetical protein
MQNYGGVTNLMELIQLGVPYKFSNVDLTPARNTVEEVYGFINSDLDNATVLLSGSVGQISRI